MGWNDMSQLLGNYGEFFSAIAVFLTLGYLAVQVREARKSLVRQNERNLTSDSVSVCLKMVEQPQLAKIYLTGVADLDDLVPEERLLLHMWLWSLFSSLEHATIDQSTGRFESEILNVYGEAMVNILRAPGAKEWYDNCSSLFTEGLQDYIAMMLPLGNRTTFDILGVDGPRVQ
jgi:hypothetical protein